LLSGSAVFLRRFFTYSPRFSVQMARILFTARAWIEISAIVAESAIFSLQVSQIVCSLVVQFYETARILFTALAAIEISAIVAEISAISVIVAETSFPETVFHIHPRFFSVEMGRILWLDWNKSYGKLLAGKFKCDCDAFTYGKLLAGK
jgi:hypothetical protein